MARKPRADELRLWGVVTSTVRPHDTLPAKRPKAVVTADAPLRLDPADLASEPPVPKGPLERIEPNRRRRIVVRARAQPLPKLDLHGMDKVQARRALAGFLAFAHANGERAVLVITGKGFQGDGILRKHLPGWLGEPDLRVMVSGLSTADPHHGGEGAVYVALKRRTK